MSDANDARPNLGVIACTAIVVGNMVGSGFYLSPSALAPYGLLAILSWVVMGGGAICLGLTFSRLARLIPATGGPYAYTRLAFGDFAGFLVAWGYWISIWTSLPVIAVALAGSVIRMAGPLGNSRPMAVVLTLGAIWFVVATNLRGVKEAGIFAMLTTYAKMVPFGAIAVFGLLYIRAENLSEFNPSGQSLFAASAALAPLTMFAFLGLESATVPAGDVADPHRTIPRATLLGILIATSLYILGTIVVLGVVPREQLVHSTAPFADAAQHDVGTVGSQRGRRGRDHLVAGRAERLDAAHGPGADGRGAGRSRFPHDSAECRRAASRHSRSSSLRRWRPSWCSCKPQAHRDSPRSTASSSVSAPWRPSFRTHSARSQGASLRRTLRAADLLLA